MISLLPAQARRPAYESVNRAALSALARINDRTRRVLLAGDNASGPDNQRG